jgi:hypothetical protein
VCHFSAIFRNVIVGALHEECFPTRRFDDNLDGIDDAVVKLDGQAHFAAMNQAAAAVYQRLGLNFFDNMKGKSVWEVPSRAQRDARGERTTPRNSGPRPRGL